MRRRGSDGVNFEMTLKSIFVRMPRVNVDYRGVIKMRHERENENIRSHDIRRGRSVKNSSEMKRGKCEETLNELNNRELTWSDVIK